MSIYRFVGISCLIVFMFPLSGYSEERFQTGVNFTLGFPQGEFIVNNTGLGGTGYFLYKIPKIPISVGASIGILVYGSETREELLESSIPEVVVDVTTRNYILMSHIFVRAQPADGYLRPYVDGLIGFNYIWTETGIYDQSGGFDDEIASSVNVSDFALSYGLGGGLMIKLYQSQQSAFAVLIDLGARYLWGGKAEYLKEGDIIREDGMVFYDTSYSNTDLFTTHIGVTFSF